MSFTKWCPNGCGKQVIAESCSWKRQDRYICLKCKRRFTKEQIKNEKN